MSTLDPLIGKIIDSRYLINARLARGGMASVYRATDQRLGREVAMKIIHPHLAEQEDFTNRFIQEARSAAALSNAHIVNVHDQGIADTPDGQRAYLVMELVTGPNLRRSLSENGSFSLGTTLEITRQTLIALSAAHEKGYVHRDVKPENILLSAPISNSDIAPRSHVNAKVADFGLARAAASSTGMQTSSVLGTVAYIAPEIVARSKVTPASDVYSVGIMIYELLAGKLPYSGESPLAIAYAHVNDPVPRLSDLAEWIPPAIDSLIALYTAKDAQKRPQNAAAALDVLDDITESIPEELMIRRIPVFPAKRTSALLGTERIESKSKSDNLAQSDTALTHTAIISESDTTQIATALPQDLTPTDSEATTVYQTNVFPSNYPISASTTQIPAAAGASATTAHPQHKQKTKKRGKRTALIILLLFLLLGIGSAGGYWYFTAGPGLRIAIPSVAALDQAAAEKKLQAAGFEFEIQHEFSDEIAKSQAIGTDPNAGTKIHPSKTVKLIISDGVEYRKVPDVKNKSLESGTELLKAETFSIESSENWSEDVPKGQIISQDPAAGSSIPHDSVVKVVLSKGRQPLPVPQLLGMPIDQANSMLAELGLKSEVIEEFSDEVAKGKVISQDVANGEVRYRNDVIKLVVSKGPKLVEVPNVVGQQEGSAKQVLERAGFKVEIERILGGFFGTVRLQNPGAGEMVPPGSVIKLSVV